MTTATLTLKTALGGNACLGALKDGSLAPDGIALDELSAAWAEAR